MFATTVFKSDGSNSKVNLIVEATNDKKKMYPTKCCSDKINGSFKQKLVTVTNEVDLVAPIIDG